jgi:hypothetical protein
LALIFVQQPLQCGAGRLAIPVLCAALEPIRLPPNSGSAWRGLIGSSLRRSVCVTRQPTCDGCLLRTQCAYSAFFESPPGSLETAARCNALPHPFVLEPERLRVYEFPGLVRIDDPI